MTRVLLVLLLIAAGCSDGDPEGLRLDDPWARPSPSVATTAAFFVTIENSSDVGETLVRATTDACRVTELHMSSMTDGVMRMQQMADGIEIPALTTVVLQPGGLHIMCIDKIADFAPDEELTVDLEFRDGTGSSHTESMNAVVEDR
ncbi:MAG: copper chaperone PCu(A)C [Acidimicrobiia bacterium]|nr:copper chaperone PCu(A)C [Acidimicrobiia bacterium]